MAACVVVLGLLAAGGVALFAGSSTSSNPASTRTPADPTALKALRQSVAAAEAKGSFDYVSSLRGASGTFTTVGQAGRASGLQNITTKDANGSASFTVVVSGSIAYFRGDATALEENLGLNASTATSYANRWIFLTRTDGVPYASVYAAVNARDALNENISMRPYHMGTATLGGRSVVTVAGAVLPVTIPGQGTEKETGTATLYVAPRTHLPLRYVENTGSGRQRNTLVMTFSHFGSPVNEIAPQGAVAFSSISGSSGNSPSPSFIT